MSRADQAEQMRPSPANSLDEVWARKHAGVSPSRRPTVAVIGAGCSGLVTAKELRQRGLEPVVFEMGSRVGGLWVFGNDNGRGGAYRSLRINTSRTMTEFSDFPLPPGAGDYPGHDEMAKYFAAYAEHFDLLRSIRFRTEVKSAEPIGDNEGYRLTVRSRESGAEETLFFDALVVANGHHFEPSRPALPGLDQFKGAVFHSHEYLDPKTPVELSGRRVCVIGAGNSAVDIASEATLAGAKVTIAMRTPTFILPKYLFGKPIDQGTIIPRFLPGNWRRKIATIGVRLFIGKMSDFGLPEPTYDVGQAHPTLSDTLPQLVQRGEVQVRGAIRRIEGNKIWFEGGGPGDPSEFDVLILATGYRVSFPFFSFEHISAPDNTLPLFGRVFHPQHRRVFFVGLAQTIGAITRTAELQARWIAAHLSGDYNLPEASEMEEMIQKSEQAMRARYVPSARHTMQVDPEEFRRFFSRELARGQKRARLGQGIAFEVKGKLGA
jgi:dimethylaniline monooxygenase (N-oxide forming)